MGRLVLDPYTHVSPFACCSVHMQFISHVNVRQHIGSFAPCLQYTYELVCCSF